MDIPDSAAREACPFCHSAHAGIKAGKNGTTQRYRCGVCNRRYTLVRRPRGFDPALRERAEALREAGLSIRAVASQLNVSRQTVLNWLRRADAPGHVSAIAAVSPPRSQREEPAPAGAATTEDVDSGNGMTPEERRPTIRDVALAAGVSNATVSNYLNGKGYLSKETRQRVATAIEALHYTPNALVRAIRQHRTRILGVLMFGVTDLDYEVSFSLAPPLLSGINTAANDAEYNVLLYPGWLYRPSRHPGIPFLDGHIDGLLWVAPELNDTVLERLAAAHLPVVTPLTRRVPEGVGYVHADNFQAMHDAVSHLKALGHRRIAYAGPTHNSDFMDRWDGFQAALVAAGLPVHEDLLFRTTREAEIRLWWNEDLYTPILDRLLRQPDRTTAIVLPDDGIADRMIAAMHARGLRVPEDLSIIGFNDIPDAERIGGGLTTIRQPFREIGRIAVERLLALLDGAPIDACRIQVPTELVIRRTTAAVVPSR